MYHLIEKKKDLDYLSRELCQRPYLAIDTEFWRTSKDNLQLALLQIHDSEEIYIIDCILVGRCEGLMDFLVSDKTEKIFHSCREDLEALFSWTNLKAKNIFDTQTANAFLGNSFSVSYQDLVKETLGVSISKQETRSNWIRRPLSNSQLDYAASDVQFLIELYSSQRRELISSKKIDWLKEELNTISSNVYLDRSNKSKKDSKSFPKENSLLREFIKIIVEVSERECINETLLFSKKNQRDFVDSVSKIGLELSIRNIANWRAELLYKSLRLIFKDLA